MSIPRLKMDECLRQLHLVTPEAEIHVGWDAVVCLARLFPPTWLIGADSGSPFAMREGCSTGALPRTDILSAVVAVALAG